MNNPTNDQNDTTKETVNESTPNQCNDIGNVSGIYKIVNKVNGKYYVGSSVNIPKRWYVHKSHLKHNKHRNPKLQSAYNKYGKDSFEFIVQEQVLPDKLIEREQCYLDECRKDPSISYNLTFVAGAIEFTDEIRKKMSFRARNRSVESKRNMSVGQTGKILSEIHRRKIGDAHKGMKRSEETRRKISESQKGKICPPVKDSTRHKLSIATKERFKDENYRNKMISYLRPGKAGMESPNADLKEYTFEHKSGEVFKGTRFEFYNNRPDILPLGVHRLIHKTSKTYKGWRLI